MLALNEAIMHPYHHMHHPPLIQGSPQQHKTTPNVQLRSVGRNITLFIVAVSQIYPVTSPVTLELITTTVPHSTSPTRTLGEVH